MAAVHNVPVGPLLKRLTMEFRLTGLKVARARFWVAIQLLNLAGFVAGTNVSIEVDLTSDRDPRPWVDPT